MPLGQANSHLERSPSRERPLANYGEPIMRLRATSTIFGALTALGLAAGSAQALPAPKALDNGVSGSTGLEQVHYRGFRHCHWRYGYRRCHGGYAFRYQPYYSSHRRFYSHRYSSPRRYYGYRSRAYRRSWW